MLCTSLRRIIFVLSRCFRFSRYCANDTACSVYVHGVPKTKLVLFLQYVRFLSTDLNDFPVTYLTPHSIALLHSRVFAAVTFSQKKHVTVIRSWFRLILLLLVHVMRNDINFMKHVLACPAGCHYRRNAWISNTDRQSRPNIWRHLQMRLQ